MIPRIFIVDDEQDLLLIYQLILEPEGYDVRLTENRPESPVSLERG